jgi:DNA modification methylase
MGAFGFTAPILVTSQRKIVAGHGRVLAAAELGWNEVPTICLDHLTPAQATAYLIADNRLSETSKWDDKLLAQQLKMLSVLNLDFSLEAIGFEMGEIDIRIESLATISNADGDRDDALPSITTKLAVSRSGDLWLLGSHRLYCGSALDPNSFVLLMDGQSAELVFTDPPYNVKISGHVSGLGAIHHREFAMAAGEMDAAQFTDFLTQSCTLMAQNSIDGAIHFICMDWRHSNELLAAGRVTYSELKNTCVWVKSNAGMGSLYRSQHEFIFVYKYGKAHHRNNIELGKFGRHRSNVWNYQGINSFGRAGEEGNLLALHPTVKPVAMVADAILDCSARGGLVLDPFLGSGTTLIALSEWADAATASKLIRYMSIRLFDVGRLIAAILRPTQ